MCRTFGSGMEKELLYDISTNPPEDPEEAQASLVLLRLGFEIQKRCDDEACPMRVGQEEQP